MGARTEDESAGRETKRRVKRVAGDYFGDMIGRLDDLAQPGLLVGEARAAAQELVGTLAGKVLETVREHPEQRHAVASAFWNLAVENRGRTLSAYHALIGGRAENIPFVRQIINLPRSKPRRSAA